jgi:methionyl-tRNA formyltransferase
MNVVFFGSSRFVIPLIETLNKNFTLELVITTEKKPTDAIPSYCAKHNIPYLSVSDLSSSALSSKLSVQSPKLAILAYFGLMVPEDILNLFPYGIINIHPSLLPKYRGPTPVQQAILNGDNTTGVTIIKLDNEIDHGPILFQKKENILPQDTSETLYERLFKLGADSTVQTVELYVKGKIKPKEQDHKKATITPKLTRQSGYIDSSKLKAQSSKLKFDRLVRAYHPWPGVWTDIMINDKLLRIKFLPNKMIQVQGKKPMSYKDFVNGYGDVIPSFLSVSS